MDLHVTRPGTSQSNIVGMKHVHFPIYAVESLNPSGHSRLIAIHIARSRKMFSFVSTSHLLIPYHRQGHKQQQKHCPNMCSLYIRYRDICDECDNCTSSSVKFEISICTVRSNYIMVNFLNLTTVCLLPKFHSTNTVIVKIFELFFVDQKNMYNGISVKVITI